MPRKDEPRGQIVAEIMLFALVAYAIIALTAGRTSISREVKGNYELPSNNLQK